MFVGKLQYIKRGIWQNNPVFINFIGLSPILFVANSVKNAFFMGILFFILLFVSTVVASLLRHVLPVKIRMILMVFIIAGITCYLEFLIRSFASSMAENFGVFLPLLAVNCMVMQKCEFFAFENDITTVVCDSLGNGVGFLIACVAIGIVTEFFNFGSICGFKIFESWLGLNEGVSYILIFLSTGLIMGVVNFLVLRRKRVSGR